MECGCTVHVRRNADLGSVLIEFSRMDYTSFDGVIVVLMTHGRDSERRGAAGRLPVLQSADASTIDFNDVRSTEDALRWQDLLVHIRLPKNKTVQEFGLASMVEFMVTPCLPDSVTAVSAFLLR